MNSARDLEEKLREAACFGDLILLKQLIWRGVNLNSKNDMNGWTALHWAACRNNVEAVNLLLNSGADRTCLTSKGESASDLSTSDQIRFLLGAESSIKKLQDLPIVPNYLKNPPLIVNVSGNEFINRNYSSIDTDNVLVLKVRVAESFDPDFVEVELPKSGLTFEIFRKTCCQELGIELDLVSKVRKLPNSIVRNDKDVKRLKEFDELEIVKKSF